MPIGFIVLLLTFAAAAPLRAQTLYRCDDGRGGVLYADNACPNGHAVDLPPHRPDPAARERLERELREFEARQAAREAAWRDAERRRPTEAAAPRMPAEPSTAPPSATYAPLWLLPIERAVRPRSKPAPRTPPSYLPRR